MSNKFGFVVADENMFPELMLSTSKYVILEANKCTKNNKKIK